MSQQPSHGSMRLWAVHAGFGLFVVRAETESKAKAVAVNETDGAGVYGHTLEDVHSVTLLDSNGPAGVLEEHYG
jgi:hypothetical protein